MKQTESGSRNDGHNARTQYETDCLGVLAEKQVLALLLKECATEYADVTVEKIADECIEGVPEIASGADTGFRTPDGVPVPYDIKFHAKLPNSDKLLSIAINIMAQDMDSLGYSLQTRATAGCAALFAAEYGTARCENLLRAYSIWVCLKPPKKYANAINMHHMAKQPAQDGSSESARDISECFDFMRTVILTLGDPNGRKGILRLLDILFAGDGTLSPEEKRELLKKEFSLDIAAPLAG